MGLPSLDIRIFCRVASEQTRPMRARRALSPKGCLRPKFLARRMALTCAGMGRPRSLAARRSIASLDSGHICRKRIMLSRRLAFEASDLGLPRKAAEIFSRLACDLLAAMFASLCCWVRTIGFRPAGKRKPKLLSARGRRLYKCAVSAESRWCCSRTMSSATSWTLSRTTNSNAPAPYLCHALWRCRFWWRPWERSRR